MALRMWFPLTLVLPLCSVLAVGADEPKSKAVEFEQHSGHFEKRGALQGEPSFAIFSTRKSFDDCFGVAATMRSTAKFVPQDAFDKKIVVATVTRGNKIVEYQVEKATVEGNTLTLSYKTTSKDGGSATFASPLIVTVDKGEIAKVVFVADGKEVGKAELVK